MGDTVKKIQQSYHRTIKIKHDDVKSKAYINFKKGNIYKDPKFKVDNYLRIWKYKYFFAKGFVLKQFLLLKKLKILYRGHI